MMNLMRRFASTLVGKLLGGLLLVGLAGFGISNVISDLGTNDLAHVGSDTISIQDFQRAYQDQLNQAAQQLGQMPTNDQAIQLGIPATVLGNLAARSAINQFAVSQGIGVSDAKLAELVRNDPSFAGVLGTFERANFEQALQQEGYTEAQYFELQSRTARTQQLALGLLDGSATSRTAEDLLNRYRNDTRTVEYFTLNQTSLADVPTPTDADLAGYLKDHQADFRTKETRTVDIVYLDPDALAAQYQPTEDEIKAEYDRTKDQLTKVEKRHIVQVVLSDPAKEQFFKPGTSFDDDVKAAGLTTSDLGVFAKADVQDQALADAAFGLAKVGDFAVIAGIGGKRVVSVSEIQAGGTPTYDDVKAQIAKTLAVAKAKAAYADLQDEIEELRAAFKPLKDIASRYKLPVETVALTADGAQLSAVPGLPDEDKVKVANAVFAAKQGKLAPTVAFTATQNAWFDLSKVEPARDQTLAEVHDAVATAWTNAKVDAALQAEVKAMMADLDGGKSFQDVAAAHSQFATVSQPITRDGDKTNVLTQQVATNIFSGGPDSHGWVVDGDGEYLVYHVLDVTPPTGDPAQAITDYMTNSTRDSLYSEFGQGITDEIWPPAARGPAYQRMLAQLQTPQ
ncbi:MAG TPA: SurA N-terminal domain-containing protein [Devosia sp.]|nr:SurA N-terminal domain-containing protein [Devosia sp.]